MTRPEMIICEVPAAFARWWQRRDAPNDPAIVAEAERRGLIMRTGGLLSLTHSRECVPSVGQEPVEIGARHSECSCRRVWPYPAYNPRGIMRWYCRSITTSE
jgi:hypothetical protein